MDPTGSEFWRIALPAGPLADLDDRVLAVINEFRPLPFRPACEATSWLRRVVADGILPLDTYLLLSEDGSRLLGFFVTESEEVVVSEQDLPVIILRTDVRAPNKPQSSLKLVWIARSEDSPKGLGQTLFEDVLLEASECGAVAVRVLPADEATARKVWIQHYHFRTPRPRHDAPDEWDYLWHTVGEVPDHLGVW